VADSLKKKLFYIFLCIFFFGMAMRYLDRAPPRSYCDFKVYYHTAKAFLAGQDIYARPLIEITPFKYSPFFALLISPLGLLPIKAAAVIFLVLNFFATVAMLWLTNRICISRNFSNRTNFLIYFLELLFMGRFIVLVWDSGQVNIIMCALLLLSLYSFSKGRDICGAAALAGSVFFKYMPVIFVPYFALRKKFKIVALTVLFVMAWMLLPALYAGFEKNFSYLASWLPSISASSLDWASYVSYKNQSIFSFIARLLSPRPTYVIIGNLSFTQAMFIAYILAGLLYLAALIPAKNKDTGNLDFALLFSYLPLFNPNGWMHNFVFLIFPFAYLINYLIKIKFKDYIVLTCLILAFILTSWLSPEVVGKSVTSISLELSCITIGALFMVLALLKLKFGVFAAGEEKLLKEDERER